MSGNHDFPQRAIERVRRQAASTHCTTKRADNIRWCTVRATSWTSNTTASSAQPVLPRCVVLCASASPRGLCCPKAACIHERQARVPVRSHFGQHVTYEPPPSYEASIAGGSNSAGMLPTSVSANQLKSSHDSRAPQDDDTKQEDLQRYRHKRYHSNGRDPRLTAAHRTPGSGKPFLGSAVLHAMSPSLPPSTLATLAQLDKACYLTVAPYLYCSITIS